MRGARRGPARLHAEKRARPGANPRAGGGLRGLHLRFQECERTSARAETGGVGSPLSTLHSPQPADPDPIGQFTISACPKS